MIRQWITLIIGIIIIATVMLITILAYIFGVKQQSINSADAALQYATEKNVKYIEMRISEYESMLKNVAVLVNHYEDLISEDALDALESVRKTGGFERMGVITTDNRCYLSNGNIYIVEPAGKPYKTIISDILISNFSENQILTITVPILSDVGTTRAQLTMAIKTEDISRSLKADLFRESSYFYVIDSNGKSISTSDEDEYMPLPGVFLDNLQLPGVVFDGDNSYTKIVSAITNKRPVHSKFSLNGVNVHAHIEPLLINNWFFVLIEPTSILEKEATANVTRALGVVAVLTVIFIISCFYVFYIQYRARHESDLDERCFRVLSANSNLAIVEWKYSVSNIKYINSYDEILHPDISVKKNHNDIISDTMIFSEDVEIYKKLIKEVMSGNIQKNSVRIRLKTLNNTYLWTEYFCLLVNDKKGVPYKAIGFFENIDEKVKEEESLDARVRTDALTRLLNKDAVSFFISETLRGSACEETHAMICVDLDNFKAVNDNFGHMYGDVVLTEVSAKMKTIFRSSDILGRFGGDEFVLLIKNTVNEEFVREKAEQLRKALYRLYTQDGFSVTVSASVGVALFPNDGANYEELYKNADAASYEAKRTGKNKVVFFGDIEI